MLTSNEKIIGVETMKTRIFAFHKERIERTGSTVATPDDFDANKNGWSNKKIIKEFRALPENMEDTGSAIECRSTAERMQ
jgi:hypothetical protein